MLKFDKEKKPYIYPYRIKYKLKNGEIEEKWALPNKEWWINTSKKYSNISIIEFFEYQFSEDQINRFNSVKDHIVENYGFEKYILEGEFPKGLLDFSEEIRLQIQAKEKEMQVEENEERKEELREEIQEMIPRPSLQEMLDFVAENFNK